MECADAGRFALGARREHGCDHRKGTDRTHAMSKFLGIDYGDTYIGLALADRGHVAVPYTVVRYDKDFMDLLAKLVHDERITDLVVGWPLSMSGAENERTRKTEIFIRS